MPDESDAPFRYPLEKMEGQERDPLRELIRLELRSLLGLLKLYSRGEEVQVDGFRLLNEGEDIQPVFSREEDAGPVSAEAPSHKSVHGSTGSPRTDYRTLEMNYLADRPEHVEGRTADNNTLSKAGEGSGGGMGGAAIYEPRIPHVKSLLENLLRLVELEKEGKPVEVDGFRLKDLRHWLIPSAGDPAEVFEHLATGCNCRCLFCYLKGNPPSLALVHPRRPAEEEYREALTRLKYFSPEGRRALFPSLGSPHEVLAHPRALDLLEELRRKSDRPFRLSTNGNTLTPESIHRLAAIKPVYLYLSLNSASPERRAFLMGGREPERALGALPMLREKGIPCAVVIVPWPVSLPGSLRPPLDEMLDDLRSTAGYADRAGAHLIEVSLPGTSRYFSDEPLFDLKEVWGPVVSTVRALRREVRCPVLVKPSLYEENLYEERKNLPRILGLVSHSPAALAGLKTGDLILSINGLKISSRPQARDILLLHHRSRTGRVTLETAGCGGPGKVEILTNRFSYPYTPETDHHLGIIFMGSGFRPGILEDLQALIAARGAKRVLFLSSALVRPVFEQSLRESHLPANVEIDIRVPANRFFGGNIYMGDLLVAEDFIAVIREYLQEGSTPDLVVLPSTPFALGDWKRDLTGRYSGVIERAAGVPVALLECGPMYD